MKNISLKIKLKNGLELDDPFMIASSHLTDSENAFQNLAPIKPAAITTKTISERFGGNKFTPKPRRILKPIHTWSNNEIGLYADGPKETELWGVGIAYDLLIKAKEILPHTKIGISVLQGENYNEIKSSLFNTYDFVELNLKYSLRLSEDKKKKILTVINEIKNDITEFCETFKDYPKFIKVSREAYSFFTELFISDTLNIIKKYNAAVIIANSKKMDGPPSYVGFSKPDLLKNGVIVGDYLFPETYNIIKEFYKLDKEIEIVANGGIMSIGEIFDCIPFGIKAFQICTLVHRKKIYAIEMLRKQLKSSIKKFNCASIDELSELIVEKPSELSKISNFFPSRNDIAAIIKSNGFIDIKDALTKELLADFPSTQAENSFGYEHNIKFIGTKGSILSYYLSFYLSQFKNYRISIEMSKSILDIGEFDSAIISDAYIKKLKNDKKFVLEKIGIVRYGLMSITQDLEKIAKVFLFESAGSEEAKIELSKRYKFHFEYIKPEALAPLLIGWDESLAILAKYPLTNFYKYLLPSEVQGKWQEVFSVSKPIWLCTKNIPDLKKKIMHDLSNLVNNISDNSIINFVNFGFIDYLVELLMEKR
jgi:dihydroorotate dehydrogenase